jgi:hypothetical protein
MKQLELPEATTSKNSNTHFEKKIVAFGEYIYIYITLEIFVQSYIQVGRIGVAGGGSTEPSFSRKIIGRKPQAWGGLHGRSSSLNFFPSTSKQASRLV